MLCHMLAPVHELMARFLCISGAGWRKKQAALAAQGKPRSWAVLEAARLRDVNNCMELLLMFAISPLPAAKQNYVPCEARLLCFVMASGGLCSLQSLLRLPRQGLPYQVFKLLENPSLAADLLKTPPCQLDEFCNFLFQRYPSDTQLVGPEGLAILEAVADLLHVDVAGIEATHASTREFSKLRSKGWTASLECISSRFVLQQRQRHLGRTQASGRRKKRERKPKQRRGGGGAWRAYVHHYLNGRQLTAQLASEMSAAYRDLEDAERSMFVEAGSGGTLAHKHGFKSFPSSQSSQTAGPRRPGPGPRLPEPGGVTASGAIVAMDRDRDDLGLAELPYIGDTLADRYEELRRKVHADMKAQPDPTRLSQEEEDALKHFTEASGPCRAAQDMIREGHSQLASTFAPAPASQPTIGAYSWCPPVEAAVKDGASSFDFSCCSFSLSQKFPVPALLCPMPNSPRK